MRSTRFFFVNQRYLNMIYLWKTWVPHYHPRRILFSI